MIATIGYLYAFWMWCILPQIALGLIFDAQIEHGAKLPEPKPEIPESLDCDWDMFQVLLDHRAHMERRGI